jgi:hypothetical protein
MSTKVFVAGPHDVSTALISLVGRPWICNALSFVEYHLRHGGILSFKGFSFRSDWMIVLGLSIH